ncbi:hypothetical protein [Helicobacter rodentium]|uniref:hypothetical protein n=1 Tax=Helicobacter rodentium TaxID=59617 RepID=UPI0025581424|nr:hypothetical protein [Helicobacter rodentium]
MRDFVEVVAVCFLSLQKTNIVSNKAIHNITALKLPTVSLRDSALAESWQSIMQHTLDFTIQSLSYA